MGPEANEHTAWKGSRGHTGDLSRLGALANQRQGKCGVDSLPGFSQEETCVDLEASGGEELQTSRAT